MRFKFAVSLCLSLILLNSCSNEKQNKEMRRKEAQKKDSISTSKYYQGIELFQKHYYNSAKSSFENVDSLNKYFNKSQEYIKIINDSLQVYKNNTLILLSHIDSLLLQFNYIDYALLFDSLVSKGILDEDYIKESYRNKIEEDYRENEYTPDQPDDYY